MKLYFVVSKLQIGIIGPQFSQKTCNSKQFIGLDAQEMSSFLFKWKIWGTRANEALLGAV